VTVDTLLLIIASALVAPLVAARAHARYQQRLADRARPRAEKDAMAREAEQALLTLQPRAFFAPGSAAEIHNEFEELAAPRAEAVGNADVSDRIGRLRLLVRHAATLGAGQHWQFAVGTAIEDARYALLAYLHDEQPRRVRVPTRDEVGVWAAQGPDMLWRELAQYLSRTCG
jgi:hypothetical protein